MRVKYLLNHTAGALGTSNSRTLNPRELRNPAAPQSLLPPLGAEGEQPSAGPGLTCKAIVLPCTAGFSSHRVHTTHVAVDYSVPLPKCFFVAFRCPRSLFLALTFPSPENHCFSQSAGKQRKQQGQTKTQGSFLHPGELR